MDDVPAPSSRSPRAAILESRGPAAMALGLVVNGAAAYVFLAAAGQALGADDSGQVSVLWASLYLIGTGLFLPLEQELSRSIAARRAVGEGYGALVRRVSQFGTALCGSTALVLLLASPVLAGALFRGSYAFVIALVAGIVGVALSYLVRGLMAGSGRYYGYATYFVVDGAAKALPALVLAVTGASTAMSFAIVAVASAFVGSAAPLTRGLRIDEPGPVPSWRPLLGSLGYLMFTSLLTAVVLNSGTIAVEVLASPGEDDAASVFLSGLVIARIPLFMFQAVQAVVLPRLSHLAASGDMAGFRRLTAWLLGGIAALSVVAVAVSAAIGSPVVKLLFGDDFVLSGRDMALLTLASMLMMTAMTVNQAQIALHHQHETGWPWAVAAVVFVVVTALGGPELLARVEHAMVAAGATAALLAGALLARDLRPGRRAERACSDRRGAPP